MKFYKKFLILGLLIGVYNANAQELIISNAAVMQISPDAILELKNGMNLVNNVPNTVLGGTFVFKGTLPQEIRGSEPVTITSLNVEEGAFIDLKNNLIIGSELNLTNGIINLLNYNLRVSNGASINGSFSETAMIVADGNGKLEQEISGNGTYVFPVGDTTDVDEYSPANLIFNAGTYSDAVVGVNLKNIKHPNNSSTVNYLTRYWTINQTGINDFSCDIELNYTNNDITGTESVMIGAQWNGSNWSSLNALSLNEITGTVTNFSDFTGGESSVLEVEELNLDEVVNVIVDGEKIVINSDTRFPIEKIEVFNRMGQVVNKFKPANALYSEFIITDKSDLYLLRLSSSEKVITKKVYIW